jgi:phospholipid-binding lipoprotein MlaA
MRRFWAIIPFSMILFIQPPFLSGAEVFVPPRACGSAPVNEEGQSPLRLRPAQGLEVKPDGFGGYLYSYVDRRGYKHVTNRADMLPQRLRGQGVWAASSRAGAALQVRPDGYGGLLYCYLDSRGYKHTTNSIRHLPGALHAMMSAEGLFPVTAGRDGTQRIPLTLARSEAAEVSAGERLSPPAPKPIPDPLETLNRVLFHFNDRLYFWVLKPIATGYEKLVPQPLRVGVRNFFSNLATPIRAVSCLLQGKIKKLGTELTRFVVNTTFGVLGFGDPAKEVFHMEKQEEDLGQTLGYHGAGPGFYIHWPVLGPSSLRDTVGMAGDAFLDPINYLVGPTKYNAAVKGFRHVNETSLTIGEYEDLKASALDPYISLKDAYHQYRQNKVKE